MHLIRRVLLAALVLSPPVLAAQPKLAGSWSVRYTRAYRIMHSTDTTVIEETAQMTLHPRGDSVFGFWQAPAMGNEPAPPARTVRGTIRRDTARVQVDPTEHNDGFWAELGRDIVEFMKTHFHNAPPTIPFLEFTVKGDSLIGTRRSMTLEGEMTSPPRLFTAVRAR
jgi:hypothetical protein